MNIDKKITYLFILSLFGWNNLSFAMDSSFALLDASTQKIVAGLDNAGKTEYLYWALHKNDPLLFEYLIEQKADIYIKDTYNRTLLHQATRKNCLEIVNLLVKKGADLYAEDNEGRTALHYAAERGYFEIVQYITEAGAHIYMLTNAKKTAEDLAFDQNHIKIASYLYNIRQLQNAMSYEKAKNQK